MEDRTVPSATWNNFGGDAQHTDVAQVAAQPIDQLLWQMPLDLGPWGYIHYGDPIFTPNNVAVVPLKVTWDANNQGATNFIEVGINDVTGAVLWSTAPLGSITGASNVGNTIVLTTNNTNGLANGDFVTIGDMQGDTAANTGSGNKTYQISNVTPTSFTLDNVTGNGTYSGGGLWVLSTSSSAATSYIEPAYHWLPPDQAAYDPVTDRVYFPGPGGTIDYISNPDTATGVVTPVQEAFYGLTNYTNSPSAYNASIYVNTPLTVDTQGNIYFGYAITGSNPSKITEGGIVQISAAGAATKVSAFAAVDTAGQTPTDDGNWVAALGSAPALSNDGSTIYFAVDDGGYGLSSGESNSYLVGLNSSNLQPTYSVRLYDPTTATGVPATGVQTSGYGANLIDQSTASPMVAPDGTIYLGVFGSHDNGSRGALLHFSGNLQTEYTPGAFGWDDTPSIVPTSMVPSYTGSSSYLILSKYNNYANAETGSAGGNGVNEIAVLDPYASQPDPNNDSKPNGQPMPVMKQILTLASPSPDIPNINGGDPDSVREWCTNGTAVDPAADSIFVNNEDGYTYEWNLGTNTITHTVEVTAGYGVPYTPTAISPNGEIFSDNGGTLFALGGYANYTITTVSSANPAVYGTPFTLTTTLASTSGGPTPTGTITYTAYAGANNPLNYNTTPITLGTATLNANGVATLTLSGTQLPAAHYHITASYSGDSTYSAGHTTIALPVLETVTTTVSASANPVASGTSVTFTATLTPNGTASTVVQNGTGSSSYWVPIGAVTFMDGSTVLGTVNLNPLEAGGPNGNGTYPSTYIQGVTFGISSLPAGTNAITAVYSGDQNFAGGPSAVFDETVGFSDPGFEIPNVGTGISAYQYNPSGAPWTYSTHSGVAGNGSGFTAGNPNAPQGTQVAFIQGTGTVSQAMYFSAGSYTISFDAAQRANYQASYQTVAVEVDGTVVGTIQPASTSYALYTTGAFTVTAGTHTISFVGLNPNGGDNTAFLDNASIANATSPPPSPPPSTNAFNDAGFETPSVGTGTSAYAYNPTGAPWTYSTSSGVAGNGSAFTSANPNAPQGTQVAFIQQTGTVSQTVTFTAGTYTISFDAAQRADNQASYQTIAVEVDGSVVGTVKPASTSYALYSTSAFTVTAGTHTVSFVGLNPNGGDNTSFLDNASIATATSPPPPPSNQFSDPDFATPNVGTGFSAYEYNPAGAPWTYSTSSGVAGNGSAFTSGNPNAPQGAQVAFIQGTGTISQVVTFTAGTYTIGFDAAQRAINQASSQTFEVEIDGQVVGTFTPSGTSYALYTTNSFTVSAGTHTVEFVGLNPNGGDNTAFLDEASIS